MSPSPSDDQFDPPDVNESARDLVAYVVIGLVITGVAVVLGASLEDVVPAVVAFPLIGAVRLGVAVLGLPAPTVDFVTALGLTAFAVYGVYFDSSPTVVLAALVAGWFFRDSVPELWRHWRQ
ncbi:hypothetical protein [Halogranum rubrum]|uniref:hypothetical protein n=1 Tax=Halogranum rubrum TaxID=553466 RepID=UPI0006778F76|nr:hypothetical protein [Halogranum salarium]